MMILGGRPGSPSNGSDSAEAYCPA
jgi:hypothetical protein